MGYKIKPSVSKLQNGSWEAYYQDSNGVVYRCEGDSVSNCISLWYKKYSKELMIGSG